MLYEEIYGDRIQAQHILDFHNRATLLAQSVQIKDYKKIISAYDPVVSKGNEYNLFLKQVN